jgi:nucleoid-associated protein YgaU
MSPGIAGGGCRGRDAMRTAMLLVFGATLLALVVAGTAEAEQPAGHDEALEASLETPAPEGAPETEPMTAPPGASDLAEAGDSAGEPPAEELTGEPSAEELAGEPSAEELAGEPPAEELAGEPAGPASPDSPAPLAPEAEVTDGSAEVPQEVAGTEAESATAEVPADTEAAADGLESAAAIDPTTPEAPAEALPFATGYDAQGRPGRIHVVVSGDTLWDISEAYLGTPWVWPSIWKDNREIENPHVIHPGDRIWITPTEMRRVSAEEAQALLAGGPAAPEDIEAGEGLPAAPPEETLPDLGGVPEKSPVRRVSSLENVGLVTSKALESAASIVDAVPDRVMLSQGDRVYIGLGEGDVEVEDEFIIFRTQDRVLDPGTGRLLGYHVDILGWMEVEETHAETSVAVIRLSTAEIERGDRVVPRTPVASEISVLASPSDVDGRLAYFAASRTMMGMVDFVYLNRGTLDGLDVGSPLEVYRPAYIGREAARRERVRVAERVVAELLVVKAEPNSSVAFVTHTDTELHVGDHFRGAAQ